MSRNCCYEDEKYTLKLYFFRIHILEYNNHLWGTILQFYETAIPQGTALSIMLLIGTWYYFPSDETILGHLTNYLELGDLLDYRFRGNYLNQQPSSGTIDFDMSEGPYGMAVS